MKSKLRHSSTPSAQSTLPPWVFKYCDENLVWFLRTNSMLPDDFPCFGECGNDNYNVIWHCDMLLRLFLATSAPSGDRYAHVSIKEIESSTRYGPGFTTPTYPELVAWFYRQRARNC